jgi:hypothetical protein
MNIKKMLTKSGRAELKDAKKFKEDMNASKKDLSRVYNECKSQQDYIEYIQALSYLLMVYNRAVEQDDNQSRVAIINDYRKWLNMMIEKAGKQVADEVEINVESYAVKIEELELVYEYAEKLTDLYNKLDDVIDQHDVAKNAVVESLTYDIDGDRTVVPFIQPKDLSLNNLEFAYKTRIVCESLKNSLKNVNYLQEANILERFIELNLESIEESINIADERHDMNHKVKILKNGALYLNKLQQVIDKSNFEFNDEILEESGVFNDTNDVDRVVNRVKEYVDLDNPNKDMMEMVMAEAIVEYTILETLNTLNLVKYT